MSTRPRFSVVVPLFNEEDNIAALCERLRSGDGADRRKLGAAGGERWQ